MKKNRIKDRAKKVPEDVKQMVIKSMATARYINGILEKQGKSQKDLALSLGKKESEISKWLRGSHNFTFKTICKIEVALGEQIFLLPTQAIQNIYFLKQTSQSEETICLSSSEELGYTSFNNDKNFKACLNVRIMDETMANVTKLTLN
ncbi:MAG: helix-turn-helix transcriptional regulator [Bacteroidota bacterium]|nr:helix-turn-helix transcriptional regulator [Bacteroidota bacterium]